MEIRLGRRADYSLRAVLHLAIHDDQEFRSARSIAEATDVPVNYLPQLLTTLVDDGLVVSTTGRRGGYRLAHLPEQVSMLDVIRAVGGDSDPVCVLRGGPCHWQDECAFHEPWTTAKQALRDRLAATSFADIVALDQSLAGDTWSADGQDRNG